MSTNRYTNLQYNQYAGGPEYIPLPFDTIAAVGAAKQQKYDDTKSQLDKSLLDANIKSIAYHDEPRNKWIKQYNDEASSLINQNIDFGSPEGKSMVNNLINKYKNNEDLQVFSRSIDNFKKQKENIEELKKKPGAYAYYNDPTLYDEKMFAMGINPYATEDKLHPLEYNFRPIQSAENHQKAVEDIYDNIKSSGSIKAYADFSGDKSYIQSGKNGWEGVSDKTIEEATKDNLGTFLESSAGQDWSRKFHFDNLEQLAKMSPEERQSAEQNAAYNYMLNIGKTFKHGKSTQDKDLKTTSVFDLKAKRKDEEEQLEPVNLEGITLPSSVSKVNIPVNIGRWLNSNSGRGDMSSPPVTFNWNELGKIDRNTKIDFSKDQKKVLERAEKFYGQYYDSDREKAKLINKYVEDFSKGALNIGIHQYTDPKYVKDQSTLYFGDADNKLGSAGASAATTREFKLITGDSDKDLYTGKEFLKQYGNSEDYNINITGELTPNNPYFSAGKVVTVTNKDGEVEAQFAMKGNNKEITDNKQVHDFFKAKFSPTGESETTDLDGNKIKIVYEPISANSLDENGRPTIVGEEVSIFKNGQLLTKVKTDRTKDAIEEAYNELTK